MRKINLLLIGIFILFSCNSKTAPSQSNPVNAGLEATHWKLVMLADFPEVLPASDREVYLMLEAGKISGFGGCNSFFGSYSSKNETIKFMEIGSTKMYCEKNMAMETSFFQALKNSDRFTVTGMQLELFNSTTMLARFEAETR